MSIRLNGMLLFFFFIVSTCGSMAVAQQAKESQGSVSEAPMSKVLPGNGPAVSVTLDPVDSYVPLLHLSNFEAASGDLSSCKGDQTCIDHANSIQVMQCFAQTCGGIIKDKDPTACAPDQFGNFSVAEKEQVAEAICSWVKSPNTVTEQALIHYNGDLTQDSLVESEAYVDAFKGSASACESRIKNYVGAYGPKWTANWYRDLSGCRILAHEKTREQEEKDFTTWFGVLRGSGKCTDIGNSEMQDACKAPGATSPIPSS